MPSRLLNWLDTNVVLNALVSILMSLATLILLDNRRLSFIGWLGNPNRITLHWTLARPPGYDVMQPPEPFLSPSILPLLFLVALVMATHWLARVVAVNFAKTSARSISALAVISVAKIYTYQYILSPALVLAPRQYFTEGHSWLSVVLVTWLSIDYIPWARPQRFTQILQNIWHLVFLISISCNGWLVYSSMDPQQLTSMNRYLNTAIYCVATIASYLLMIHLVKSVTGISLTKTTMIGPLVVTLRKVALVISRIFQVYGDYMCSIVVFVALCTRILLLDDYRWPMLVLLTTGMVHYLSIRAGIWLNAFIGAFKLGLIFTIVSVGYLINFRSYVEAQNLSKSRPLLFRDIGTVDQKSTPLSSDIAVILMVIVYSILSLATWRGVSGAPYASTEPSWDPQSCSKLHYSPQNQLGSPVCTRPTVFLIGTVLLGLGYSSPIVFLPYTFCTLVYLAWRQKLHNIRRQMTVLFVSILFGALLSIIVLLPWKKRRNKRDTKADKGPRDGKAIIPVRPYGVQLRSVPSYSNNNTVMSDTQSTLAGGTPSLEVHEGFRSDQERPHTNEMEVIVSSNPSRSRNLNASLLRETENWKRKNSGNGPIALSKLVIVPPQYCEDIGLLKILDKDGESQQNRLDHSPGWTEHEPLNPQREPAYNPPGSCGLNDFLIAETENWKRKYPGSSVEAGSRPSGSERRVVISVDYGTTFTGVSWTLSYPEPGILPELLDWAPIPKSDKVPTPISYRRAERSRLRPVVVKPEVIIDIGNRRRRPDQPHYRRGSWSRREASSMWEIGRATSAAPVYFNTRGSESSLPFEFIDGSVQDECVDSPLSAAPPWTPAISCGGKTQLARQYVTSIGTGIPGPSSKPGSSPSFCTFCGDPSKEKVFKTKQDWKRHCHDIHERSDWNYSLVIRNFLKSVQSSSAFRSPTTQKPNGDNLLMLDPRYRQRLLDNLDALVDRDDNLLKDLLDPGESSNRGSQDNIRDWLFDAYMHTGNGKERDSDGMPPPGGTGIIDTDDEIGYRQEIGKRTVEMSEEQRDAAVEEIDSEFLQQQYCDYAGGGPAGIEAGTRQDEGDIVD